MAVLKYKNPNYTVGGTEEKYLPLYATPVSLADKEAFSLNVT